MKYRYAWMQCNMKYHQLHFLRCCRHPHQPINRHCLSPLSRVAGLACFTASVALSIAPCSIVDRSIVDFLRHHIETTYRNLFLDPVNDPGGSSTFARTCFTAFYHVGLLLDRIVLVQIGEVFLGLFHHLLRLSRGGVRGGKSQRGVGVGKMGNVHLCLEHIGVPVCRPWWG